MGDSRSVVVGDTVYDSIRECAKHLGVTPQAIHRRLKAGMSMEDAVKARKNRFRRGEAAALARKAGISTHALRARIKRGDSVEQALLPRTYLSEQARARGISPTRAHQRAAAGATREEALAVYNARELIAAAKRARPGFAGGRPGADVRKLLAAGMSIMEALESETARAWARMGATA